MAKPARKAKPKPCKSVRTSQKRRKRKAPTGGGWLVWATAAALTGAVVALGAILILGPEANRARTAPVATVPLPTVGVPILTPSPAGPAAAASKPQVAAVRPLPPAQAWQHHAMPAVAAPGQPMIAVVIDDMGLDRARSERTVELPAPLTLAYLAYARDLVTQTGAARAAGHELLVHVPMEPGPGADPGPNALVLDLTPAELHRRIEWNLSQFGEFVGINNHMGSKATADRPVMAAVMIELRARGLLFLDSRTSSATVAQSEAERHGIPALRRDVFLDHDPSPIGVRSALLDVEEVARRQGHAIAIGHPRDTTIDALAEWLPDVRTRGFALVPVSAVAMRLAAGSARASN